MVCVEFGLKPVIIFLSDKKYEEQVRFQFGDKCKLITSNKFDLTTQLVKNSRLEYHIALSSIKISEAMLKMCRRLSVLQILRTQGAWRFSRFIWTKNVANLKHLDAGDLTSQEYQIFELNLKGAQLKELNVNGERFLSKI